MIRKLRSSTLLILLIILLGTIFQNPAMFKSGMVSDRGIGYWGPLARDGVWHEALVGQLTQNLPPKNPGMSGVSLSNYHYFYDLMVAKLAYTFHLAPAFLIYQFLPIVFSLLLGFGTYLLCRRLFKSNLATVVGLYLVYFGSSFGWVIDLLRGREIGGESAFWANQPVSMNINPPFAISLVMVIFILLFLDQYLKTPKKWLAVVIGVMSGLLIGFKVYAGVVILAGLFFLTLKKVFADKDYKMIQVMIVSGLSAAIVALLTGTLHSTGLLAVQPLWLVDTMIDAGDRVGIPNFTSRRFTYISAGKYFHLTLLEILCIFIFITGNLGTRIFSFVSGGWKYFARDMNFLLLVLAGLSLFPTLIFVQKGNPWNIVQFFYYFLFFMTLLTVSGLENIRAYASKKTFTIIFVIFVVLTPISSLATFRSWLYPNPPAYIPTMEVAALQFLSSQSDGVILKHPFDKTLRDKFKDPYPLLAYADSSYVAATSYHEVYLEDVEQQIILDTDYKPRLANLDRFFVEKDLSWSNQFLKENNIRYVYLPKVYQLPMAEKEYSMEKIFENSEVNIYKVN